eukprot:TRINITY_DN5748_c0_g1_i5.p1 TRINITY_DN5748_c0_g1~~TRINITY_DN5748_c0_g1_i5.p1  ORF type:complete len:602 (-),score=103.63 TRINITY_DN5748_c0_g1_i5:18-1823(-)
MVGEELFEVASVQHQRANEAICAVAFDTSHELLWAGTNGGAVQGFLCPSLERYSVWQAHVEPVVGLLSALQGPLSASADCIQLAAPGGFTLFRHRWEASGDVRSIDWERPGAQARVLIGHVDGQLSTFDLESQRITIQVSAGGVGGQQTGLEVIRSNGRMVACGGSMGEIVLRDMRASSWKAEATLEAHLGRVTALDLKGDLLVSCGLSQRLGQLFCDPLAKVFDLRHSARPVTHVPFAPGPSVLRFQPKFSSLLLLGSASGATILTDVQQGGKGTPFRSFRVDCSGDALLTCDVSSSGEFLAFGDSGGFAHLWAANDSAAVNLVSQPLDLPDFIIPKLPHNLLEMENLAAASLRWAGKGAQRLSDFDPPSIVDILPGRLPPRKVDRKHLQEALHLVDFVGYVPNPVWRRGMTYEEALQATAALRNARQKLNIVAISRGGEDAAEIQQQPVGGSLGSRTPLKQQPSEEPYAMLRQQSRSHHQPLGGTMLMPRGYRHVQVKQERAAKFEEFDFSYYNKTHFAGLENDFPDCFINPLLQVFFFLREMREAVTSHICELEGCLTCELGFVLHMLGLAEGGTCQVNGYALDRSLFATGVLQLARI